jgi:hypothetical protein
VIAIQSAGWQWRSFGINGLSNLRPIHSSQLPVIDNVSVLPGDSAYILDDGSYWIAKQPSAPPGAPLQWLFIDTLAAPRA